MGQFSEYMERALLNHVLGGSDYVRPATVYVALLKSVPLATEDGTDIVAKEADYEGYARVAVLNDNANWPAATGNSPASKTNGDLITFPVPTDGSCTITHFAICDDAEAGEVIGWGSLDTSMEIVADSPAPEFSVGTLTVTLK